MRLSARHGDLVTCLKHGIGLVDGPERQVLIEGGEAAVLGDPCQCVFFTDPSQTAPIFDAPNKIMAGMADILVGGKPLAAMGHNTVHDLGGPKAPNGAIATGSALVLLGGNTIVGDADAAREACMEAAATRGHGGPGRDKTLQSYENCGCEATRQIVNGRKKRGDPGYIDEDTWFYKQIEDGNAQVQLVDAELAQMNEHCAGCLKKAQEASNAVEPFAPTPEQLAAKKEADLALTRCEGKFRADLMRKRADLRKFAGGSGTDERDRQTAGTDAATEQKRASLDTALAAVGQGKGVIMPTEGLPGKNGKAVGQHIVVVTAVVLDESGNPVSVTYNDSFNGCGISMPASDFDAKVQKTANANVTKKPVW